VGIGEGQFAATPYEACSSTMPIPNIHHLHKARESYGDKSRNREKHEFQRQDIGEQEYDKVGEHEIYY
jgi:hypothetical protein